MGQTIHIEIVDRKTGARVVETCDLPIEIGKQPQSENRISLDAKYVTISRVHGRLEQGDGTITYVDCSSNGTTVSGNVVKGEPYNLKPGETFQIENYDLRVLDMSPLIVKHTREDLKQISEVEVLPGKTLIVTLAEGGIELTPDALENGTVEIAARISFDGTQVILDVLADTLTQSVRLNKARISGDHIEARMFDVIEFRQDRFELLKHNHNKIVCGNPECHLLNDLPFEENCVWCGFYLAASGSFTRVTLP